MRKPTDQWSIREWWLAQRRKGRYKKEPWQLTLEETEQLWGDLWWDRWPDGLHRWHVWRRDPDLGWTYTNTELITSGESGRRKQEARSSIGQPPNPDSDPWYINFPVECEIDEVHYESINEAARELGVSRTTVRYRLSRDRWPTWRRIRGGKDQ